MFAISSDHTKTISLRNQMERIIPERLRMENSLSYFDFFFLHPFFFFFFWNLSLQWKRGISAYILIWEVWHQEDSLGLWLHALLENIQFVYDPANDSYQVVYRFQDAATRDGALFKEHIVSCLSFWKSPQGEGVEREPTFLHEALIKPSVEGKTGLDSWPFPTSTQLVHLKRPCDRNSMPQEIERSCDPVVCFSVTGLFFFFLLLFNSAFSHFFSGNEGEELGNVCPLPSRSWSGVKRFLHLL